MQNFIPIEQYFNVPQNCQNFGTSLGVKKSKCENNIKWGPNISQMTRRFRIWHRNSNRITVYQVFGQKNCRNLAKSGILLIFDGFLGKKRVNCYPISIPIPDWESSHHLWYIRPSFHIIFPFWFFDPPLSCQNCGRSEGRENIIRSKCHFRNEILHRSLHHSIDKNSDPTRRIRTIFPKWTTLQYVYKKWARKNDV